jgi:ATPase subunit of ABC transporter with duplicated ATPase domains
MSSIRLERLTFSHADAVPLFTRADAHLPGGWTAVVGENGAGKTTLLRLVVGSLVPTEGRVHVLPEGARVVLCPQEDGLDPGPDALLLAGRDDGEARRLRGLLRLDPLALPRFGTLSPGERRRWRVGSALAREPDVLLLDEPTNHADAEARAVLLAALVRFRGTGLVVSHDRALLDGLAERTLRIHGGAVTLHAGCYAEARASWEAGERAARERREEEQRSARAARARLDAARRDQEEADRSASGRRSDPRDHDARSMEQGIRRSRAAASLARKVGRLREAADRADARAGGGAPAPDLGRQVFLGFARAPSPVLLALDADRVRAGATTVLRDVHVRLRREDRVRVEGANGAGKSTLLRALLDGSPLRREQVLHLPQELPPGSGQALLRDLRALAPDVRGRVLSLVAALGTDPARLLASADPSPGEARKLGLALGMGRHAWALVLDEPTNHLDLPTVERLEAAIAAYPGAVLLVSHDAAFAARCTTSRWIVTEGRVTPAGG